MSQTSVVSLMAGGVTPGYQDGSLLASAFYGPSTIVYYNSVLYVADNNNCVIRQVDILRQTVSTVAGSGVCARSDGAPGATVYPANLTYSAFSDFLLLMDQYPNVCVCVGGVPSYRGSR